MKNKYFFIFAFVFNLIYPVFSQNTGWVMKDPFEQKVFIENKGQFDKRTGLENSNVYYGANDGGFQIYFTPKGLTYRMDKWGVSEKKLKEEANNSLIPQVAENDKLRELELLQTSVIQLEWVNANPDVKIISAEPVAEYFNYASNDPRERIHRAKAFKKLIYKNLYPGIDLVYAFHTSTPLSPASGTKYALILHPGADPAKIQIKYSGADNITMDENGNILLATPFGNITDHAPVSFYSPDMMSHHAGSVIPSSFQLAHNHVSFHMSDYDNSKTVVIDPWTTNPLFATNKAWDVESDPAGNVYVFGGGLDPFGYQTLKKYDSFGTPQWTYTLPYFGMWHGDLAVDNVGNSYVSSASGTGSVIEIDNTGTQVFYLAGGVIPSGIGELFCMVFNKPKNQLVGTTHFSTQFLANLNLSTGVGMNFSNIVGGGGGTINEIRSLTSSPNGNFYALSCNNGAAPATVIGVTPALAQIWTANAGYAFADIQYSGPKYTGFVNCATCGAPWNTMSNPDGQNGIAASQCFVYTYEGKNLKKWNIANGALVGTVAVPTGIASRNSGVIVDSCDFVYVGTTNGITKYNPALVAVNTFPTPDSVYCLSFGATMGTILACGNRFVGSFANSVNPQVNVPFTQTTATTSATGCSCSGSATVSPVICSYATPTITYLWSNGQTTKTISGLCAGSYSVTTTAVTLCGIGTQTSTAVVGGNATGLASSINSTSDNCNTSINSGAATVNPSGGTPAYTFTWSNGQTAATATGLNAGTTYTVTITDATTCSLTRTVTIVSANGPSATMMSRVNILCNGGNNGSATVAGSGGVPGYSYSWSGQGGQTAATATGLSAGTYTVTITDANSCTIQSGVTITQPLPLKTSVPVVTMNCTTGFATATIVAADGTTPYTYAWSSGQNTQTATGITTGTYTVTISDANGCIKTTTVFVAPSTTNASFTQTPGSTFCPGTAIIFTNTGTPPGTGITYEWLISTITPANVSGTTTNFSYTFMSSGTYSVRHTVKSGNCSTVVTSTVTIAPCAGPTVIATSNSICPGNCATITTNTTNGTTPYTYSWSNGATTQNINPCPASTSTYTLTVTDAAGVTGTTTVVATVNPAITLTTSQSNISCNGSINGSGTASISSGTSPYSYSWSNGQTVQMITGLSAGSYSVTVTDSKGCTAESIVTLFSPPVITGQFVKGTANCSACGCKEWVMINAAGGTIPYSFTWPDGYVNRYKNRLCPGNYNINIKDKNGCSINVDLTAP